jgi:hypothetical protein
MTTTSKDPFDQASRYLAKRNPGGLRGWLLPKLPPTVQFAEWLDTRSIPFPGQKDRVCDTVAHLVDSADPLFHWALVIEFQLAADADMFGRLLEYLGRLWRALRVPGTKGVRFHTGAAVINLTGRGHASQTMTLANTAIWTGLGVEERDLVNVSATATLERIAAGTVDRCLLPWIPLMQGGNTPAIIGQWKTQATAEPDAARRGDWGGLALVFADAVDTGAVWKQALEGWNVETSQQVLEWQAKARIETRAKDIVSVLRLRFGNKLPKKLQQTIMETADEERLEQWLAAAVTATSLQAFRSAANL